MLDQFLIKIYKNTLYKNSFFLMFNTALLSFFGFIFWIIASRLYTNEEIGLATTLLTSTNLISSFSLLGFNNGIIRFLPTEKDKFELIHTSLTIVSLFALIITVVFLLFISKISPKIAFISSSFLNISLLISTVISIAGLSIVESIFVSERSTKFVVIYNTIYNLIKVSTLLVFIKLGTIGIYLCIFISTVLTLILALSILRIRFSYVYRFKITLNLIKKIFTFSANNFIASFLGMLPSMILPIWITNILGPKVAAYYYMPMMVMSFIYIIPIAISRSLLAEGAHNEEKIFNLFVKSISIIYLLIIPTIILINFFGNYILLAFGKEYSLEGIQFLRILAFSGIFASITYIGGTYVNMKKKTSLLVLVNLITSVSILVFARFFINNGLIGIGISWLIGQIISSFLYVIIIVNELFHKKRIIV